MVPAQPAQVSPRRIVVVSPHLDDAVISLGASIASWRRTGATIDVLTVLACDPHSATPAGGWDRRGGFATEGESARARREEDREACGLIGATPAWLPFGSVDYERHGADGEVRRAVAEAVEEADLTLLPGYPLTHPDHEWLVRTLLEGTPDMRRIGFYAEQPYTRRAGIEPQVPAWVSEAAEGAAVFEPVRTQFRHRLAKWRAIRRYCSQLPLLGMRRSLRRGPHRYALSTEWIAWPQG